jgi:hypothetical protein
MELEMELELELVKLKVDNIPIQMQMQSPTDAKTNGIQVPMATPIMYMQKTRISSNRHGPIGNPNKNTTLSTTTIIIALVIAIAIAIHARLKHPEVKKQYWEVIP